MRFFEGCTALITGASAGLGTEFARQLAPVASTLVLVARRTDRLDALKHELEQRHPSVSVRVYGADLANPTQISNLVRWLEGEKIRVNFLINNAGLGDKGPFATADWARVRSVLEVNVAALTQLTYLLLPALREGGRGAVLNVSSIAGLIPVPYMAVYGATKAYVNSFSEALRIELRDTGVTVTALLPGPAETEFADVARRRDDNPAWSAPHGLTVPVDEVVRAGLLAVARDRARVIPGWKVALFMGLAAALPLCVLRAVLQHRRG